MNKWLVTIELDGGKRVAKTFRCARRTHAHSLAAHDLAAHDCEYGTALVYTARIVSIVAA